MVLLAGRRIYGDFVQDLVCGNLSGYSSDVVDGRVEVLVDSSWTVSSEAYQRVGEAYAEVRCWPHLVID